MNMKLMKVKLTLTNEMLGMAPSDPNVHAEYIASKAPDAPSMEEEIEAIGVDGVVEKGRTVFPTDDEGNPVLWDYQIRGFFKDSLGMLRSDKGSASGKIKNYKKVVDGHIFIVDSKGQPKRQTRINLHGEMGLCERPLRAETMRGPRTALASSETVPAGSTLIFTIGLLGADKELEDAVRECLDYGVFHGLGQWRNAGKGTFTWEELKD